ncbi:MAG: succinyldiaminopimelate transaminase [Cocleimonas sp.]|nr:succinyldiaminopimelate transaminase [Cocleimonas sp.]
MNPNLKQLQPYPFQRISELKRGIVPPKGKSLVSLAIGEPKHPTPDIIIKAMQDNLIGLGQYPLTKGSLELRTSIAAWLTQRFNLPENSLQIDHQILPVNGTREALFAFAQTVIDPTKKAKVLMPNPFYQIYEGAALLAGAEPFYLPCTQANDFNPDFDAVEAVTWDACQLIYLCSPANPTGAVVSAKQIKQLLALAEQHDFIIASDECYSEIYLDEANPPVGLLEVAAEIGNTDYKRCVVFHSLSKRSNAPGLRSGFIAGDAEILSQFLLYRTYHGSAMSPTIQATSIAAWNDEQHVLENRNLYRAKFSAVLDILSPVMDVKAPDASFYLWAGTPINDERFTREIYAQQHLNVVPGRYLSRDVEGVNPGANRVRLALVATLEECVEASHRMKHFIQNLG